MSSFVSEEEESDNEGESGGDNSESEEQFKLLPVVTSDTSDSEPEKISKAGKRKKSQPETDLIWTETDEDLSKLPDFPSVYTVFTNFDVSDPTVRPLDYFQLFFTDELLASIVATTNKFADILLQKSMPFSKKSRLRFWKPVSLEELKKYIGLCIFSALLEVPRLEDYWSTTFYQNHAFPSVMSRNRFQLISQMLHFSTEDFTTGDPFAKIRPISDYLKEKYMDTVKPGKQLALDETMVSWRGRLGFRQYIKNKKHKYGIKVYKLCTHDGFVLNFLPYVGKTTILETEQSKTAVIVNTLMESYIGKGHELYMDNYYNSVPLALELYEKRTLVVGTLRANRKGNPKHILATKLKKGEAVWTRYNSVLVTKWKDKRDVLMISTKHNHQMRKVTNKRGLEKEKPECILDYNKFMGGVDKSDQMTSYNALLRRTKKWYKRFFFFLLDTSISNSFILAKDLNKEVFSKLTITDFREQLVLDMCPTVIQRNPDKPKQGSASKIKSLHFLKPIEPIEKKKNPCKRCEQCKLSGVRKESRYECEICQTKPALCVFPCFRDWHLTTH